MFPRTALLIVILLMATFVAIFVRGMSVAKQANCQRHIAEPYKMLLDRMRVLADAQRTEELHALITKAQEHTADVRAVCEEPQKERYAMEVYEWTR
jgi:predicted RNA-binding Zn ribbon-like protein